MEAGVGTPNVKPVVDAPGLAVAPPFGASATAPNTKPPVVAAAAFVFSDTAGDSPNVTPPVFGGGAPNVKPPLLDDSPSPVLLVLLAPAPAPAPVPAPNTKPEDDIADGEAGVGAPPSDVGAFGFGLSHDAHFVVGAPFRAMHTTHFQVPSGSLNMSPQP